jgi:diacylglycerol kinase family enzyme
MRCLFVSNPTARSGRAGPLLDEAAARLRARGLEVSRLDTAPGGGTTPLVRDALDAAPFGLVVAAGGDGTFGEVARGLLLAREARPRGLLPLGTANDQARSLGIPEGPAGLEAALDIVLAGHVTRLDAGRAQALGADGAVRAELIFFDSIGWGMHPEVLERRNRDRGLVGQVPLLRDLYRDEAVYAGAVLQGYVASWLEPTKFDAEVQVDGRPGRLDRLTDLIIKATAVYAGSWVLDPTSRPDDGRFELVPIAGRRDWFVKAVRDLTALAVLRDDLEALGATSGGIVRGATFDVSLIRAGRPQLACQVDGEEWVAGDRFHVEVLPGALPLFTPRGWRAPWDQGSSS